MEEKKWKKKSNKHKFTYEQIRNKKKQKKEEKEEEQIFFKSPKTYKQTNVKIN